MSRMYALWGVPDARYLKDSSSRFCCAVLSAARCSNNLSSVAALASSNCASVRALLMWLATCRWFDKAFFESVVALVRVFGAKILALPLPFLVWT